MGLLLGGLALAGATLAHAAALAAQTRAAATSPEAELRALEREWVKAEVARDAAALRRILDQKFIAAVGSGSPLDREGFIHSIVSGKDADVSQTLSDPTIVTDGDTGVVVGTDTLLGFANGTPYTLAYTYTATYIRRGGGRVALAEHLVRAPEAKGGGSRTEMTMTERSSIVGSRVRSHR